MARFTLTFPSPWLLWLTLFISISAASSPNRTDTILFGSKAPMEPTLTPNFYASVIATDATATTYAVTCPQCREKELPNMTAGPSTVKYGGVETLHVYDGPNGTTSREEWRIQGECEITQSTSATCTLSNHPLGSQSPYHHVTQTLGKAKMLYVPVTVTAGVSVASTGTAVPSTAAPSTASPTTGGAMRREDMVGTAVGLAGIVAGALFA